jgi:acylphosphatase
LCFKIFIAANAVAEAKEWWDKNGMSIRILESSMEFDLTRGCTHWIFLPTEASICEHSIQIRTGDDFMIRATFYIAGRVQGVGFRYTTCEVSKTLDVVGTVENLEDGRVKIVVEGEPETIDMFIESVQQSMSGKIKTIDRFDCPASHEYSSFSIRR